MTIKQRPIHDFAAVGLIRDVLSPLESTTYSQNSNTESASPTIFASALDRRKHESALSLFPKFNAFVRRTATCWLWVAGCDAYGYGQIYCPAKRGPMKTHRLAWMFANGPIPKGAHVLHKCDVRNCVNPDHLFLGDQAANMKDAAAKGRLNVARPNNRTLTSEGEQVIRAAYAAHASRRLPNGLRDRLAAQLGVTPHYVTMIGSGRTQRKSLESPAQARSVYSAGQSQPDPRPSLAASDARG